MLKWAIAKEDRRAAADGSGTTGSSGSTTPQQQHARSLSNTSSSVQSQKNEIGKRRKLSQSADGLDTAGQPNGENNNNNKTIASQRPLSSHNNKGAVDLNADSKSLLYMSLDHLPLAIVKQYERMLQEEEDAENCENRRHEPNSRLNNNEAAAAAAAEAKKNSKPPTLPCKPRTKTLATKKVILPLHGSKPASESKPLSTTLSNLSKFVKHKKKKVKRPLEDPQPPAPEKTKKPTSVTVVNNKREPKPVPVAAPSPTISTASEQIRHAKSRSLRTTSSFSKSATGQQQSASTANGTKPVQKIVRVVSKPDTTIRTSSQATQTLQVKSILKNPLELNNNNVSVINANANNKNVSTSSAIVTSRDSSRPSKSTSRSRKNSSTSNTSSTSSPEPSSPKMADLSTVCHPPTPMSKPAPPPVLRRPIPAVPSSGTGTVLTSSKKYEDDHDTTDPQFLEMSKFFPAVPRRAKKLTLKRSELRKLEKIRNQTDRLNKILRKYYHEWTPNLPEEEDSQCSPEEKSLAILKNYLGDYKSGRRNLGDLLNDAAFSGIITNSSSSFSSSSSSSSSITSSSSSECSAADWVLASYSKGSPSISGNGRGRKAPAAPGSSSSRSRHSRSHRSRHSPTSSNGSHHGRIVLSPANDLPSIQEDSAEVSSASVKSVECGPFPNNSNCGRLGSTEQKHYLARTNNTTTAIDFVTNNNGPVEPKLKTGNNKPQQSLLDPFDQPPPLATIAPSSSTSSSPAPPHLPSTSPPAISSTKQNVSWTLEQRPQPPSQPSSPPLPETPCRNIESPSSSCTTPDLIPETGDTGSIGSAGSSASSHGYGSGGSGTASRSDLTTPTTVIIMDIEQEEEEPKPRKTVSFKQPMESIDPCPSSGCSDVENQTWNSHQQYGQNNNSGTSASSCSETDDNDDGKPAVTLPNNPSTALGPLPTLDHHHPNNHGLKSSRHQVINNNCNPRPSHNIMGGPETISGNNNKSAPTVQESEELDLHRGSTSHLVQNSRQQQVLVLNSQLDHQDTEVDDDEDEDDDDDDEITAGECSFQAGVCTYTRTSKRTGIVSSSKTFTPKRNLRYPAKSPRRTPAVMTPGKKRSTPLTRKTATPRKLVRKAPVATTMYTGKGEVLIRSYTNGDFVTLHVVMARNLQPSYRCPWKMAIKISLLPEAEATFTKSESVEVEPGKSWTRIDQKFSFETAQWLKDNRNNNKKLRQEPKVFLTFWKRQDKKTSFLGWTTVNVGSCLSTNGESEPAEQLQVPDTPSSVRSEKTWQSWLKLRKRKMNGTNSSSKSSSSYQPAAYAARSTKEKASLPPLELDQEIQSPDSQEDGDGSNSRFPHHHHPDEIKSQFPNSATMDSGVEDCCEPAPPLPPAVELDETQGKRVRVRMTKEDGVGYGFSVVWVSPPRIERMEKCKIADNAGLQIGDLIIGVNGEDVTSVPNTTIYHNMKTTGNQLELEVWRKNSSGPTPAPSNANTMQQKNNVNNNVPVQHHHPPAPVSKPANNNNNNNSNAQIGSMVMMLMTGTGTPLKGGAAAPPPASSKSESPAVETPTKKHAPKAHHHHHHQQQQHQPQQLPQPPAAQPLNINAVPVTTTTINNNNNNNHILPKHTAAAAPPPPPVKVQPPPVSILKPPPPAPPTDEPPLSMVAQTPPPPTRHMIIGKKVLPTSHHHPQPTLASSSWKIRFNVELLDNEEDSLKQFFICELKYFRKVVAALDRYLIPAQANKMLSPQEIHSIFAHIITIITMTKRILQCVANNATSSGWKLGEILFTTHSDHLSEMVTAYTNYAKSLATSALILSDKMVVQDFARFVIETPVPKGHLDITNLLFAPLEHLRNLCEICDEIVHNYDHWTEFNTLLKECYANIVVQTDFMEPISHVSMKKHPLLSVRDLEKRIVTTNCQTLKVCEKGRKWLFGSRLFRKESDGSWAPVWAFLFTDIVVLTSHMTRDRVFFVKEPPIRLEDVVTLHFNLPRKNENEFRLSFSPEPPEPHRRLDRLLPLYRRQKSNQIVLRASNKQLKAMWKLLLQRQIITLNTRLSKSSSSNFSISEFCEKFPEHETSAKPKEEKIDEEPEEEDKDEPSSSSFPSTATLKLSKTQDPPRHPNPPTPTIRNEVPNLIKTLPPSSRPGSSSGASSAGSEPRASPARFTEPMSIGTSSNTATSQPLPEQSYRSPLLKSLSPYGSPASNSSPARSVPSTTMLVSSLLSKAPPPRLSSMTSTSSEGDAPPEPRRTLPLGLDGDVSGVRSVVVGKFVQKPVEMLASPSEGSPRKYNLNTTRSPSNNNNNDIEAKNLNRSWSKDSSDQDSRPGSAEPVKLDKDFLAKEFQRFIASGTNTNSRSTTTIPETPPVPAPRTSLQRLASAEGTPKPAERKKFDSSVTPRPLERSTSVATSHPPAQAAKLPERTASVDVPSTQRSTVTASNVTKTEVQKSKTVQRTSSVESVKRSTSTKSNERKPLAEAPKKPERTSSIEKVKQQPLQRASSLEKSKPLTGSSSSISKNGVASARVVKPVERSNSTLSNPSSKQASADRPISSVRTLKSDTTPTGSRTSLNKKSNENLPKLTRQNSTTVDVRKSKDTENKNATLNKSVDSSISKQPEQFAVGTSPPAPDSVPKVVGPNELSSQHSESSQNQVTVIETSLPSNNTPSVPNTLPHQVSPDVATSSSNQHQTIPMFCNLSRVNPIPKPPRQTVTPSDWEQQRTKGIDSAPNNDIARASKVHMSSPIVSGFGSERSRRRLLVDYQVRQDYPELFGISPRDRRSFIKQLGELLEEDSKLVAPYYMLSPLPKPRNSKNISAKSTTGSATKPETGDLRAMSNGHAAAANKTETAQLRAKFFSSETSNSSSSFPISSTVPKASNGTFLPLGVRSAPSGWTYNSEGRLTRVINVKPSSQLAPHPGKISDQITKPLSDEDYDYECDGSDSSLPSKSPEQKSQQTRSHHGRRPSPEESASSNDSGISEEFSSAGGSSSGRRKSTEEVIDKMLKRDCGVVEDTTRNQALVQIAKLFPKEVHNTCPSATTATQHAPLSKTQQDFRTSDGRLNDESFFEEPVKTYLSRFGQDSPTHADSAISQQSDGHEDEFQLDFTWMAADTRRSSDRASYRSLLAEKRETFFMNQFFNHAPTDSPSRKFNTRGQSFPIPKRSASETVPEIEAKTVRILDGDKLHSTHPQFQHHVPNFSRSVNHRLLTTSTSCERVQYVRLEQEKTAHVERVESSDSATSSSSDVASASPAPENGTTDPSWSSSSNSSLAASSIREEPGGASGPLSSMMVHSAAYHNLATHAAASGSSPGPSSNFGLQSISSSTQSLESRPKPEIVVTHETPDTPKTFNFEGITGAEALLEYEEDDYFEEEPGSSASRSSIQFLRVESNDSTAENYGDDDDYNFDDDDEELSRSSIPILNRYGTFESLERLSDAEESLGECSRNIPRSKARFAFDDDDDEDLFEEDFESDFSFRFGQIQDNTYSVSRLGPLPPLLEEDYEDEMYDEGRGTSESPSTSVGGEPRSNSAGSSSVNNNNLPLNQVHHQISAMGV